MPVAEDGPTDRHRREHHWHWPWTHCHHLDSLDDIEDVAESQRNLTKRMGEVMATVDDLQIAVSELGEAAQAAADRVTASLDAAAATIAGLQQQIADLIAANANDITPEQLQAVADGLTTVKAQIEGIDPTIEA